MEAGDWAHPSTLYGHYIRCLPREVLVRILEATSASIQEANVAKVATDQPMLMKSTMQAHLGINKINHRQPQVIYWTESRNYNLLQNVYFSHFLWEI